MSVRLSEQQNNLVHQIAKNEGFDKYSIVASTGSIKGDGYLGIITTVIIKEDSSDKQLDLVLKSAATNEAVRKAAPIRKAFLRENTIYGTIFPEFQKMQLEHNAEDVFRGHAKFYGSCMEDGHETIALQDIRSLGFKLWDRMTPMNYEHVEAVFKEYAKWHASSFVYRYYNKEKYEELSKDIKQIFQHDEKHVKAMIGSVFQTLKKSVKDPNNLNALEKFELTAQEFMLDTSTNTDQYSVITHGDCWNNNMMFKYNADNHQKPHIVNLLDWQVSKVGSPLLDIAYYYSCCSSRSVLDQYQTLLKVYHDQLRQVLQDNGISEDLFPLAIIQEHWQKYAKYGLYLAGVIMKVMLREVDEVKSLQEITEEGRTFFEGLSDESRNIDIVNERLKDLIEFMYENKLI